MISLDKKHLPLIAALLVLAAGCLLFAFGFFEWGIDDAYISFRFARNLVDGHGLVFNPGERVEGYSNLLYVLVIALGLLAVPAESVYFWSLFVNVVFICLALILLHRHLRRTQGDAAAAMGAALFALCPVVWQAVASGLETPLVVLAFVWIWVEADRISQAEDGRSPVLLCVAIAVSILVRADGFVMPFIAFVFLMLKGKWRAASACAATTAVVFGALVGWRYHYYGYPLPNTYYVKVSGSPVERIPFALNQLATMAFPRGFLVYVAALGAAASAAIGGALRQERPFSVGNLPSYVTCESFLGMSWLVYWLWIGGDILGLRFLIILIPLGIVAVLRLSRRIRGRRAVCVVIVMVLALVQSAYVLRSPSFWFSFEKREGWIELGEFLRDRHRGETIAVDAAGKLPYFSELRTIDMLGLCDEHIAHLSVGQFNWDRTKIDPEYVLSREPDLIAAWMESKDSLAWGITREMYEGAGYEVAYMCTVDGAWEKKIEEREVFTDEDIEFALKLHYKYAVLRRRAGE